GRRGWERARPCVGGLTALTSCGRSTRFRAQSEGGTPMAHPALAAVHNVAPLITKYADEAERERRLARPVVDALLNAGVFRLLVPPALGGAGASPLEFAEVVEAVSAVDGSTGWCVVIRRDYGHFAGFLPP